MKRFWVVCDLDLEFCYSEPLHTKEEALEKAKEMVEEDEQQVFVAEVVACVAPPVKRIAEVTELEA